MDNTFKDVKEILSKNGLNDINDSIQSIYKTYSYIGIDKEYFNILFNQLVDSLKDNSDSVDNNTFYIEKQLIETLTEALKKKLESEDTAFEVINNYINVNYKKAITYGNSIKYFYDFDTFLNECDYFPSKDVFVKLLNNNAIFSKMIKQVVNLNMNAIRNGFISEIIDNNTLLLIIDLYCQLNNIEIIEEYLNQDNGEALSSESQYYKEINKRDTLTPEKEKELMIKIKQGDEDAKNKFIEANLKLVVKYANQKRISGMAFLDLVQEGNLGLMKAVDKFDLSKGFKFSTYATWWIRQAMSRAIENQNRGIRLPSYLHGEIRKFNTVLADLEQRLKRTPTIKEIAEEMDISILDVKRLFESKEDIISLNSKLLDGDKELEEFICSDDDTLEDTVTKNELEEQVSNLLKRSNLTEREKIVIIYRFGLFGNDQKTLADIGNILDVSKQRIKEIEKRALDKIKGSNYCLNLVEFTKNPFESQKTAIKNIEDYKSKHKTDIYDYFKDSRKEDIDYVINTLSTKEQEIILRKFNSFEADNTDLSIDEKKKFWVIKCKIEKKLDYKQKPLYSYFENQSKVDIDNVLDLLSEQEQEFIRRIYGNNYNSPKVLYLSDEEKSYFTNYLAPKINRMLLKKKNPISLYDYFGTYSYEEVDIVINQLTGKEKRLLDKKFTDYNVVLSQKEKDDLSSLLIKMRKILRNSQKNIYCCFEDYTKEMIDWAIMFLEEGEISILKKHYGEELNLPIYHELSEIDNYVLGLIKQKIQRKLIKPQISFYEFFDEYNREEINELLNYLNIQQQFIVRKAFGEDLMTNNIYSLDVDEYRLLFKIIIPKIKNALKQPTTKNKILNVSTDKITANDYNRALRMLNTNPFKDMLTRLSSKECILGILNLGIIDGKEFSFDMLSKYFELDIDDVKNSINNALVVFKEQLDFSLVGSKKTLKKISGN